MATALAEALAGPEPAAVAQALADCCITVPMEELVEAAKHAFKQPVTVRHYTALVEALKKIEAWDMPLVPDPDCDGRLVSYGSLWGANGERDLVRSWARDALGPWRPKET